MEEDIRQAAHAGSGGVVFGILDEFGRIGPQNSHLLQVAHGLGLQATFHRAFDQLESPEEGLKALVEMGFDRLLTSGLQDKAIQGLELIRSMQNDWGSRIEIMAGSGVNSENAAQLAGTGVAGLHFTARKRSDDGVVAGMGVRMVTDEQKIRAILEALK
jgi:copper homeostasis protein